MHNRACLRLHYLICAWILHEACTISPSASLYTVILQQEIACKPRKVVPRNISNGLTIIFYYILCRVDDELRVKVADFGMSRDIHISDYYRTKHKQRLPVKWMAPESLFKKFYSEKSDVVSLTV